MPEPVVVIPDCPLCEDRGWLVADDGGAGAARPCECRKGARTPRLLAAAGVPARYRECSFEKFVTEVEDPGAEGQLLRALAVARRYVDEFLGTDGRFVDAGLIFVGPAGGGKTHLAVAVLKELIRRYQVHGRFVEFTALVHQIQATFNRASEASAHQVLEPVMQAEVLVLDELGAQRVTPWLRDLLYLVVNTRYTERRPTIFTTNHPLYPPVAERADAARDTDEENLDRGPDAPGKKGRETSPEPLTSRLPASLVSRLHEMAQPVVMSGVFDYRRDFKHQRLRAGR